MRNLTIDDSAKICEIRKECFEDFWSEQDFNEMLTNNLYFGFFEENGFILCRKISNEIEIITFAVLPYARRNGIGRRLLGSVIDQCKDGDTIFLEVAENNIAALRLYQSFEFLPIATRRNYYKFSSGFQNAVVMQKIKQS